MLRKIFSILSWLAVMVLPTPIISKSEAYGPVSHIYGANRVLEDIESGKIKLPPLVRQAILLNPDAFRAGSLGPDMLNGQVSHSQDAGGIAERLMDAAGKSKDPRSVAYAYGYLVHMGGDMKGHPLVNKYAGGQSYDYKQGTSPGVLDKNPNYLHIYSEGEIDKIAWSRMTEKERQNVDRLLSVTTTGQPPQIWEHITPDTINILVKAVNEPEVNATNVFAESNKPLSAYNAEGLQNMVSNVQEALFGSKFKDDQQEILASLSSAVVSSEQLMQKPSDFGFMNLDEGEALAMDAIKEYYRGQSNKPDGGIDPKFLDKKGNIRLEYQQELMRFVHEKYRSIFTMSPEQQKELLGKLGKRTGVSKDAMKVLSTVDETGEWMLADVVLHKPNYNLYDQETFRNTVSLQNNSTSYTEKSWAKGDEYSSTINFSWDAPPRVLKSGQTFQLTFKGVAGGSPQEKCAYRRITYCWKGFAVTIDGKVPEGNCRDLHVGMPSSQEWVGSKSETAIFTVLGNAGELAIYVNHGDARADFVYKKK